MYEKLKKWFKSKGGTKKHAALIGLAIALVLFDVGQLYYKEHGLGNHLNAETSVHFIDVGQGDSELIVSGDQAVLIDAGPTSAADTVVNYLKKQKISHLHAVIATHPHEDHIGGMAAVLANFKVDAVYMPNTTASTQAFERMMDMIETKNISVVTPKVNDGIMLDSGAYLQFLSPAPDKTFDNVNNYSLVTMLEAGRHKVLFMGDAEKEIEDALVHSEAVLTCDVLKVGHHGSKTSSTLEFLKRTKAKTAVISCGADNVYGFPDPETIQNLKDAGFTKIYNTAVDGTVVLKFETTEKNNEQTAEQSSEPSQKEENAA
ncbi:MAG: ComEC/Rec2 family competence protein [Intestinibacillus sp.]